MKPVQLNDNSRTILAAVMQARAELRPMPSIRELMVTTGIKSKKGVVCHLKLMKKLGLLSWQPNLARTVVPTCRYVPVEQLGKESTWPK